MWRVAVLWAMAAVAGVSAETVSPWNKPVILDGEWKYRAAEGNHDAVSHGNADPGPSGAGAAWAHPDWDDAAWSSGDLRDFERQDRLPGRGAAWFRREVTLPEPGSAERSGGNALALRHVRLASMEIYWDGVLVGRTGAFAREAGAPVSADGLVTYLPAGLTGPGRHLLAVRISDRRGVDCPTPFGMALGTGTALELGAYSEAMAMCFLAGIFAFGALFRFLNYRATGYGRHAFLFSFSILSCSVYIAMEYLRFFADVDAGGYLASRVVSGLAWYFMLSLVPDYFIFAKTFPHRWVLPAILVSGIFFAVPLTLVNTGVIPFHYLYLILLANQYFSYVSIGVSTWVIAWALRRRQLGSGIALAGILSVLVSVWISWQFEIYWAWAAGVAAHVICLTRAQSMLISERLRGYREDQLRSARLEIELLKKNIQPHFLLNSLNSIIAWLEEEPKTAVRLVNALADELHMLLKISAEKTIPLEEEIRLCRAHLQVMGLRQDKTYHLVYEGDFGREQVPPMVLHTLVENGITHGYAGRNHGTFTLRREELPGRVRFSLFNDGSPREKAARNGDGTGLRYVRTRLEEAFPGRWSLDSRPARDGWQVVLDLHHLQAGARVA